MTMPALGESVTEGTVTRWLKAVGDEVTADEPLLEVSTDKVDTEIPSPVSGTLLSISVNEDETVDVGAELAVIGAGGGGAARPPRPRRSRRQPKPGGAEGRAGPRRRSPSRQPSRRRAEARPPRRPRRAAGSRARRRGTGAGR